MGESDCSQTRDSRRSVKLWVGALTASLGAAVIGATMVVARSPVQADVRASMMKDQMVVQNAKEQCSGAWTGHQSDDCIYIENCKEVEWRLFGNLEVWSVQAFNALLFNIDSCSESIDWVIGTKYGPIGEDLFAQMCMDMQGCVQGAKLRRDHRRGVPRYTQTVGDPENKHWKVPCDKVMTPAMHPFKKPDEYFSCLDATLALDVCAGGVLLRTSQREILLSSSLFAQSAVVTQLYRR